MTHTLTAPAPPQTEQDTLEVVVTLEDIRYGSQGDDNACAVARAARRVTDARSIWFWSSGLLYVDGAEWRNLDAGRWAARFDVDKTSVAPERFRFVRER